MKDEYKVVCALSNGAAFECTMDVPLAHASHLPFPRLFTTPNRVYQLSAPLSFTFSDLRS